jgi:hypothetical protein
MGSRNLLLSGSFLFLGLLVPTALAAQEGAFAYQIRGGGTLPVLAFRSQDEGWEGKTGPGTSLAMGFTIPLIAPLGGYLGFSQHRFGCDGGVCPGGKNWISTGFDVALRLQLGEGRTRWWLQGGLHTHRLEARLMQDGEPQWVTSRGGGGYEGGGGVLVQVGDRMSLAPGLRYGEGSVPFSDHPSLRPRYLVLDVGLVIGF